MGIIDRGRWMGLDTEAPGLDASVTGNDALVSNLIAVASCLIGLLLAVIVIVSCACCSGDTHARQVPEEDLEDGQASHQPAKAQQVKSKVQAKESLKKEQDKHKQQHHEPRLGKAVDADMIPFQVRKAPPPTSHKIPLAPPGGTVPPQYVPGDEDPTVNVEAKHSLKA